MSTAADMVAKAASQIGVTESPADSNIIEYWDWYDAEMQGSPWCDCFVSWCGAQIGEEDAVGKYAYCPYHVDFFKERGQWLDREEQPQPGDIIFFGRGDEAVHVGVVETRNGSYSVTTIEGNTSTSSDDNGGAVMRRERTYGDRGSSWYIMGFGRPDYSGAQPEPKHEPKQKPGKALNDLGLKYRAHCADLGWCAWVHDGQIAGTTGEYLRMEALQIDPRGLQKKYPNVKIRATAWVKGGKKIKYGEINHKTVIGTVGQYKRLEGVKLVVTGLPKGKKMIGQAHLADIGWQNWRRCAKGFRLLGTTGGKKRMEAIRLYVKSV